MDGLTSRSDLSFDHGQISIQRRRRRPRLLSGARRHWAMLAFVAAPTALGATYYLGIAADQYASESRFVVRSPHSGGGGVSGLGQVLGLASGLSNSATEAFSINDYLQSHDAVTALQRQVNLVGMFRRPEADLLARLWWKQPMAERLLHYYQSQVSVTYRQDTGITTLEVRAFRPRDALAINTALLQIGEARVNAFNKRATDDSLTVASGEVVAAEHRIEAIQHRITAFRQIQNNLDPEKAGASGMTLISGLENQLSQADAQLAQMSNSISASSPQVETLKGRIAAITGQIDAQRALLTGHGGALAPVVADYDDLLLRRQFAQTNYNAAESALEVARENALKQQLFVVRVVEPNLPELALYPRRILMTLAIFLCSMIAFGIGRMVVAGVREHAI